MATNARNAEDKDKEIGTEMGIFTKSPKRMRDEAAAAAEAAQKHHAGCVDEHNCAVDHVAMLKLRRLNERKARTADAVAKRTGAAAMADEDPALIREIAKATLYKQGTFRAAEDARLDVIKKREALAAAEKAAADAAYIDVARRMLPLLGQLVPLNQQLQMMQTANLPLLSLPEWSPERFQAWQREFYAIAEPQQHPAKQSDPKTLVTFTSNWSPGGLSGKLYTPGDTATFPAETCAEIVAGGFGVWQTPTAENAKLVEGAKRRLAAIDPTEGSTRVNVGWTNDAA